MFTNLHTSAQPSKYVVLEALFNGLNRGEITRQEVLHVLDSGDPLGAVTMDSASRNQSMKTRLCSPSLYYRIFMVFGALLCVLGVISFLASVLTETQCVGCILLAAALSSVYSMYLTRRDPLRILGTSLQVVSGTAVIWSMSSLLFQFDVPMGIFRALLFGLLCVAHYGAHRWVNNSRRVFIVFASIHFQICFFSMWCGFVDLDGEHSGLAMRTGAFILGLLNICGVSVLNYRSIQRIRGVLLWWGSFLCLTALVQFSGEGAWDVLNFLAAFLGMTVAQQLRSTSAMVNSIVLLMAHVNYLTGKYLLDYLGLPLILVLCGAISIGIGRLLLKVVHRSM